ncbi:MAG TPA: hypothetical protein VFV50_16605 [Bdellovibrionales bacterium]|nr:hypothetical protein [Bdellovibrionales bacterium]
MKTGILTGILVLLAAVNASAQIRDVNPSVVERILIERNHTTGANIYRMCAPGKGTGEPVTYQGKEYNCPTRLGCRPQGAYYDRELIAYQKLMKINRGIVIGVDAVAVIIVAIPAIAAAKGIAAGTVAAGIGKGLGIVTGVNIAGWTLTPYISRITSKMDWTRYTRAIEGISTAWDVNPAYPIGVERAFVLRDLGETLNKTLCNLDHGVVFQ